MKNLPSFQEFRDELTEDDFVEMATIEGEDRFKYYAISGHYDAGNISEVLLKLNEATSVQVAMFSIHLLEKYHAWLIERLGE